MCMYVVRIVIIQIPLSFVLLVTAIKEGYEDYLRAKADYITNSQLARIWSYQENCLVEIKCKKIRVGDLVHVREGESFPADLMVVATSHPNGLCYVETSNLDGEINLKVRTAPVCFHKCGMWDVPELEPVIIQAAEPGHQLNVTRAKLLLSAVNGGDDVAVGADNMLLRGSALRNTSEILGIALYTGPDTKLVMNQKPAPSKFSHVEMMMNRLVLLMLAFVIIACVASGIASVWWEVCICCL